jgi:hypothetical protein
MCFDQNLWGTMLVGGIGAEGEQLTDAWAFDGTNWTECDAANPSEGGDTTTCVYQVDWGTTFMLLPDMDKVSDEATGMWLPLPRRSTTWALGMSEGLAE